MMLVCEQSPSDWWHLLCTVSYRAIDGAEVGAGVAWSVLGTENRPRLPIAAANKPLCD